MSNNNDQMLPNIYGYIFVIKADGSLARGMELKMRTVLIGRLVIFKYLNYVSFF